MPQGLGHVMMLKQANSTSCWISVANFCMRALNLETPSIALLIEMYQKRSDSSRSAMDGAGKPTTIFEKHRVPFREIESGPDALPLIAAHLEAGKPVICRLESRAVRYWSHAVVLVGATRNGATLGFKDPARPAANTPRYVPGVDFMTLFYYGYAFDKDIHATCTAVTLVG